jgi:hypothetical protein
MTRSTHPPRRPGLPWAAAALALTLAMLPLVAQAAPAGRTLQDYRYFRALSIDLSGRIPTADEVTAFEDASFDYDAFIDDRLSKAGYTERMRRIYMDLLRLELDKIFQFSPASGHLKRYQVLGPNGPVYVYYRLGQRRTRQETDGKFCFTTAETGQSYPPNAAPTGTAVAVSQTTLDAATTVVKPWWLYLDYKAGNPQQLYSESWLGMFGFQLNSGADQNADGTAASSVRVCKEEALTADSGTVYYPGRPGDSSFSRNHAGEPISCTGGTAFGNSADCGCGVGLERCVGGDNFNFDPSAFVFPTRIPLDEASPFDAVSQTISSWWRFHWSREAVHFLEYIFDQDRDVRELLTAPYSFVNGPLAQFYRAIAPTTCCAKNRAADFGYITPTSPLFDPAQLPADLLGHAVNDWRMIANRGPVASGLLTMPVFLTKFGSRRGRAHVLYNAFLCKDFVAGMIQLQPSDNPDLTQRPGCATCHATLEPLAAYFTRVLENDWTYLPADKFPLESTMCKAADPSTLSTGCKTLYDPSFTTADRALLRGAYASEPHGEAGPAGIAQAMITAPEFPGCVAQNLAESFLGRPLTADDDALKSSLAGELVSGGYKLRQVVRALVKSDAYRTANNLTAAALRQETQP